MKGQVSLDGKPVEQGFISFKPAAGTVGPSAGGEITNGAYAIEEHLGPAVGLYVIEISSSQRTGKQIPAGSPFPPGTMIDETKELIPKKYNARSELARDIAAGENALNFDLTSK